MPTHEKKPSPELDVETLTGLIKASGGVLNLRKAGYSVSDVKRLIEGTASCAPYAEWKGSFLYESNGAWPTVRLLTAEEKERRKGSNLTNLLKTLGLQ